MPSAFIPEIMWGDHCYTFILIAICFVIRGMVYCSGTSCYKYDYLVEDLWKVPVYAWAYFASLASIRTYGIISVEPHPLFYTDAYSQFFAFGPVMIFSSMMFMMNSNQRICRPDAARTGRVATMLPFLVSVTVALDWLCVMDLMRVR